MTEVNQIKKQRSTTKSPDKFRGSKPKYKTQFKFGEKHSGHPTTTEPYPAINWKIYPKSVANKMKSKLNAAIKSGELDLKLLPMDFIHQANKIVGTNLEFYYAK